MILIVYLVQHKYLFIYLLMCLLIYSLFNSAFSNLGIEWLDDKFNDLEGEVTE